MEKSLTFEGETKILRLSPKRNQRNIAKHIDTNENEKKTEKMWDTVALRIKQLY